MKILLTLIGCTKQLTVRWRAQPLFLAGSETGPATVN
jgi:hypothetical protein